MRYDSSSTPAPPDPNRSADAPRPRTPRGLAIRIGGTLICTALTIVIVAPIALSSQDLVRWASDPAGLGLPEAWAWLVFIALDAAAAVCVGMVSLAAWRGESGGAFHVLTWLFALGSAFANFRHGRTTPAKDDEYFFAAMSIAGPLLLDVTLARVRRWTRVEARTQMAARPRFGLRWLPGVAFRETLRAWQASLREDIARPARVCDVHRMAAQADGLLFPPCDDALRPKFDHNECRPEILQTAQHLLRPGAVRDGHCFLPVGQEDVCVAQQSGYLLARLGQPVGGVPSRVKGHDLATAVPAPPLPDQRPVTARGIALRLPLFCLTGLDGQRPAATV